VGSFPASGYGLQDMTGNLWEWTQDWYRPGHQGMAHQVNPSVSQAERTGPPGSPGTGYGHGPYRLPFGLRPLTLRVR
jgi:sulfatase modifying factor 1